MQKQLLKKVLKRLDEAILNENPVIPKFDLAQERTHSKKKSILDKVEEYMETSDTIVEWVENLLETKYKKCFIDAIRYTFLENYYKRDISIAYQNGDEIELTLEDGAAVHYNTRTNTFTFCYPIIIELFPKENYINVMTDIAEYIYGELGIGEQERISVPDEELEDVIIENDMFWNSEIKLGFRLTTADEIDTMKYLIEKIWTAQGGKGIMD